MKMKYLAVLLGVAMTGAMAPAFAEVTQVDAGTINFDGEVVSAPCVVTQADTALNVTLSDVEKNQFYAVGATAATVGHLGSQPRDFTIHLEQCDISQEQSVNFKIKGDSDGDNPEVLKNTASTSPASGVGLALFEDDGSTKVLVNTKNTKPLTIPVGTATGAQTFKVDYIATKDAVTTGDVKATATFDITFN